MILAFKDMCFPYSMLTKQKPLPLMLKNIASSPNLSENSCFKLSKAVYVMVMGFGSQASCMGSDLALLLQSV